MTAGAPACYDNFSFHDPCINVGRVVLKYLTALPLIASALSVMKSGASIVNISSIAGKRGSSNNSAYCASKFGVNAITQSLAKEVGKKNIRVNAICPVIVPTKGLIEALEKEESPAEGNVDEFINNFRNIQAALPELPKGYEIANSCLFLASDLASAITGQCINVDCGVFPQ